MILDLGTCKRATITHPVTPSRARAFFTTSIAPEYVPGGAVCKRVFVKSNGCPAKPSILRTSMAQEVHSPTRTAETPPAPPAMNDFIDSAVDEAADTVLVSSALGVSLCARDQMPARQPFALHIRFVEYDYSP